MNLDKLLAKLFDTKEREFKLTQEEKELLSQGTAIPDKTPVIDVDGFFVSNQQNPYEELLTNLFLEAKKFALLGDDDAHIISITELTSYDVFHNLSKSEKKEFLHYLALKKELPNKEYTIPDSYKMMMATRLLGTKLSLTNEELIHIINFWCVIDSSTISLGIVFDQIYSEDKLMIFLNFWSKYKTTYISEKNIINRIHKCIKDNTVSSNFYKFLEKLLVTTKINHEEYRYCSYLSNGIERILNNHYSEYIHGNSSLFLLLPDYLGKKVNREILTLEEPSRTAFSKVLYTFSNATFTTPKDAFDAIETFSNAIYYKSKVKSIPITYMSYGKRFILDYKPMPKENISIISGMLLLASYFKINSCLPLIPVIIERSYARIGKKRGYGKGSRALGIIAIETLANSFTKKGQVMLLELYNDTKSKSIKKQIELESQKREETIGVPLV